LYAQKINRQQIYVIDLTPEMTSPFKLALDFSTQINETLLDTISRKIEQPFITKNYDYQTDLWVDMESLGDVTTIKAKELAILLTQSIAVKKARHPLLLINVNHKSIGIENETIIYFMEKYISDLSVHIFSKSNVKPKFHYDWDLVYRKHSDHDSLVDSKIYLIKKSQISHHITYTTIINGNNGLSLIESEQIPHETINFNADMETVIAQAWKNILLGAKNSSIQLLKTALEKANDPNCICRYLHGLQYIRLITGNYIEAAKQIYPEHIADKQLEKQLNDVKVYCAILSNQLEIAKEHCEKIKLAIKSKWDHGKESLYPCHMLATLMLQLNQTEKSTHLAIKAQDTLEKFNQNHTQIQYINALNLANLYEQQNKSDETKKYLDIAYAAIKGLVTKSDYILLNVNHALLYEKLDTLEDAFYCWLRAAMHWASLRHQEAFGKRAAKAILKTTSYTNGILHTEEIAAALLHNLNRLAAKCHIPVNNDHPLHLIFSRTEYIKSHWQPLRYYATPQWSFIAAKVEKFDPFINQSEALTRSLTSILLHLNGAVNFGKANCIVMDSDFLINSTCTKSDVIERCILLDINNFSYEEKQQIIHPQQRHEFYSALHVIPSPALAHIELQAKHPHVEFKRFYCNRNINEQEIKILTLIQSELKPVTLNDCIALSSLETLQQMANDHLVSFTTDIQQFNNLIETQYDKDQQTV